MGSMPQTQCMLHWLPAHHQADLGTIVRVWWCHFLANPHGSKVAGGNKALPLCLSLAGVKGLEGKP